METHTGPTPHWVEAGSHSLIDDLIVTQKQSTCHPSGDDMVGNDLCHTDCTYQSSKFFLLPVKKLSATVT